MTSSNVGHDVKCKRTIHVLLVSFTFWKPPRSGKVLPVGGIHKILAIIIIIITFVNEFHERSARGMFGQNFTSLQGMKGV